MKVPVGLLSDRTVCVSRWRGLIPTSSDLLSYSEYTILANEKTHPPMKNRAFYYCGCTRSVPCRPAGATGAEDVEVLHVCVLSALRHSYSGLSCFLMIRSGTLFHGSKGFVLFSKEYKKIRTLLLSEKVRILLLWCTSRDSNPGPTD